MSRWGFRGKYKPMEDLVFVKRNSAPLHDVTHRQIGDIPGLIEAPRSGTFVNTTPEEARRIAQVRIDAFCKVLETGVSRDIKNFNSHPLFGAYGEKL